MVTLYIRTVSSVGGVERKRRDLRYWRAGGTQVVSLKRTEQGPRNLTRMEETG